MGEKNAYFIFGPFDAILIYKTSRGKQLRMLRYRNFKTSMGITVRRNKLFFVAAKNKNKIKPFFTGFPPTTHCCTRVTCHNNNKIINQFCSSYVGKVSLLTFLYLCLSKFFLLVAVYFVLKVTSELF